MDMLSELLSFMGSPYKYSSSYRYYCLSILDKHHHPDIDLEQGMRILGMCIDELKRRLPIDFKGVRFFSTRHVERRATDKIQGSRQGS